MKLSIISPNKIIAEGIEWIEINSNVGNFVIQQGHIPMLLVLLPYQQLVYKPTNKNAIHLNITKGFVSVQREIVTALVHMDQKQKKET